MVTLNDYVALQNDFASEVARAERAEAELKAMRELLIWLNRKGGLGIEVHDRISTALNRSPPD